MFPKETEDLQDSIFKTLQYTESITPWRAYNNLDQSSARRSGYQQENNISGKWKLGEVRKAERLMEVAG